MGEGLNAKTLAIVVLLFVSFCSMPSYAQDSQDETVSCCESSDFDLYLL